jgi:uncharacterized protein (DUF58 family)
MSDSNIYVDLKDLVALQYQATGFSFLPRQPVHSILSGRHGSRLRGRGLDFEELRHYRIGDDIRTMDWKVTNRTRKPHVRVFNEERERPVLLLIDQRTSMFFGSRVKMKSVVAAELAALAAWRVLDVGDRVGAIIFNDTDILEIKPRRSRKTVMQILHTLIQFNHALGADTPHSQNDSQLDSALKETERLCGHDYLIVMVSDMSGWSSQSAKRVKRLAWHNDIIASLVFDPLEKELPERSKLVLSDGDMQIQVDSGEADLRDKFTGDFVSSVEQLQSELRKHSVPVIPIDTVEPVPNQVRQTIGEHIKSRRSARHR